MWWTGSLACQRHDDIDPAELPPSVSLTKVTGLFIKMEIELCCSRVLRLTPRLKRQRKPTHGQAIVTQSKTSWVSKIYGNVIFQLCSEIQCLNSNVHMQTSPPAVCSFVTLAKKLFKQMQSK